MGNKNTDDFKKQGYTMIEYPLKGNENLIENDTKNCTNFHKANHDNIDIIYTSKIVPMIYPLYIAVKYVFVFQFLYLKNLIYFTNATVVTLIVV